MLPTTEYESLTIHQGVGRYEVWKGLEEGQKPKQQEDAFTMTEEELWAD